MLIAVLVLAASTQAVTPAPAVPAMVELSPIGDAGLYCSAKAGLCLNIPKAEEGNEVLPQLEFMERGSKETRTPMSVRLDSEYGQSISLWPKVIRLPGNPEDAEGNKSMLVGIISRQSTMYSGGGGSARQLHLFRLRYGVGEPQLDGQELLRVPLGASLTIRACFGEKDEDKRRGACHDEYNYEADLTLAAKAKAASELPDLVYRTEATAFPKPVRRDQDSSRLPPLRQSDLVPWRDPKCSYTRRLRYNSATRRYEMDRPAPDCSNYTVP
jgi:hypothetical protein